MPNKDSANLHISLDIVLLYRPCFISKRKRYIALKLFHVRIALPPLYFLDDSSLTYICTDRYTAPNYLNILPYFLFCHFYLRNILDIYKANDVTETKVYAK